jgi:PAP2 superfamily C-terminal
MLISLRVLLILVGVGLWFWTQKLISRKVDLGAGVGDRLHDLTTPLHAWFIRNPRATNLTLIVTSALIDAIGIFLLGSAILGSSLRPFVALFILFGLRQICQSISTMPKPTGVIWRHPGFPSLLVTYDVANDFFFSGHTAVAALGALELAYHGPPVAALVVAGIAIIEAAVVIIFRAHYTADVFAAAFAAWGAELIAQHVSPTIDLWLHRLIGS